MCVTLCVCVGVCEECDEISLTLSNCARERTDTTRERERERERESSLEAVSKANVPVVKP